MNYSNIIRNSGEYTIYSRGYTNVIECCIINNTVTTNGYYFYIYSGTITLINCSLDVDEENVSPASIYESTANSFILALRFLSTGYCDADHQTHKKDAIYIILHHICRSAFLMNFLYS